MGAWTFVEPYLEWVLGQSAPSAKRARYAGRPASAATATGLMSKHIAQLQAFLDEAFAVLMAVKFGPALAGRLRLPRVADRGDGR
jgi:hypothetical protein